MLSVYSTISPSRERTVAELHEVNKGLDRKDLYRRAMRVERHHIASIVNILVLAYVGAQRSRCFCSTYSHRGFV